MKTVVMRIVEDKYLNLCHQMNLNTQDIRKTDPKNWEYLSADLGHHNPWSIGCVFLSLCLHMKFVQTQVILISEK